MTAKALITLGFVWLASVVLWRSLGPQQFGHAWSASGTAKRVVLIASIYLFGFLYQVFMVGWIVPLIVGAYRLAKHR
jgi:hypothetical protein